MNPICENHNKVFAYLCPGNQQTNQPTGQVMNIKNLFKSGGIFSELKRTFVTSPVEMFLALYAFAIGCYLYYGHGHMLAYEDSFEAVVTIFPMVMVVAFLLNRFLKKMPWRAIYYATPLLLTPVWSLSLMEKWIATSNFWVLQVIVALVFVGYKLLRDNDDFMQHIYRLVLSAAVTVIAAGLLYGALSAIYASIIYIFDLAKNFEPLVYTALFIWIFGGVLGFLTLLRMWDDDRFGINKVFTAIINFIATPALIIYTAILYIYFFKIALTWELPRGGVAYMVFAFSILAVVVKSIQPMLTRRMFRWFFNWFHVIAIPLLVMFWVGCHERIASYGLTPWRISLVLCGVIMTVFILMFFLRKWGRYLYATAFSVLLLLPFALFPRLEMSTLSARWKVEKVVKADDEDQREISIYLSTDYDGRIDINGYKEIILSDIANDEDGYIYFKTIDFSLDKKKFVSDQLRKTGYPADAGFDRDYLEKHEAELLIYDTDNYRFLFSGMSWTYDPKEKTITCSSPYLRAVLIK